ncbi:MAG: DUF6798 domain-containing protein [Cyclobacteriaceae bacterium]
MNDFLKVLCLAAIVAISQFVPVIDYNEMDAIPYGYALFNPDWLGNDWYLSQGIFYRLPFSYVSGFFVHLFGFIPTIFFGRILSYIFFSFAYLSLLRATKTDFVLGSVSLATFLLFFPQGMSAGEWMIGGLETKVFSYSFALLALAAAIQKKLGPTLLFSGISFSLHLLVGGYQLICLTSILVFQVVNRELSLKMVMQKSYWFFLGGLWGLVGTAIYFFNQFSQASSSYGWDIYVQVRVPFHVLPKLYFDGLILPVLFTTLNVVLLALTKRDDIKSLLFYVLTATAISFLGISIYLLGDPSLLRYYFFRFNDTIQPFLTILIIGALLTEQFPRFLSKIPRPQRLKRILLATLSIVLFSFFFVRNQQNIKAFFDADSFSPKAIESRSSLDIEMTNWVKNNTSESSVFIAPVGMETFYMEAGRALFVSWKHSPQNATNMEEWYHRILLLNKGESLLKENIDPKIEVEKNYDRLNENEILEIKMLYPEVTHIIFPAANKLAFEVAHRTERFILYRL